MQGSKIGERQSKSEATEKILVKSSAGRFSGVLFDSGAGAGAVR